MANALSELLQRPTPERLARDYEAVFDDFVRFCGGDRVEDRFEIPDKTENADYYLLTDRAELIIELKQMNTYRADESVDTYFSRLLKQGRVLKSEPKGSNQISITPESLSPQDWRQFYLKFRPSVTTHLDKAARQLKATNNFIPRPMPERPRYFGAILMNSNDFNLSTDLLHRLVEARTKEKWKRGLYSCLDFVTCLSMDLVQEDRHLLHSRHIVRDAKVPLLENAVRFLHDRWVHYGADSIGATVTFEPGVPADDPIKADTKVLGKLRAQT